jgi:hypothetical protein
LLDDVDVPDLRAFEDGFYPYLETSAPAILTDIATKKALDDDIKKRLTDAIKDYKGSFLADLKDKKEAASKQTGSQAAGSQTTGSQTTGSQTTSAPQSTPASAMVGNK